MLFLLDANVRTVKWNGIPLHEASSAIVKEETNGDFYLTVRFPITDSGIYQLIKEDMLIKAPVPVLGAQLFRIKKPIENDDSLDITAYHISDDIMRRSIKPISVVQLGCAMALSQMVQNAKTDLGDFSFTSDISDNRTFNTTATETLYSVLMDGKHSIVGTWEGELVRDNFALSIKRSRGADRGVIITTHKNLKSYQRTKNSQNVVTRIHARSTFKPEGAEDEVTLRVTVDSPLINSYPYINEKEYENNNAKTIDELRKWAEAKFKNEGIDKVSDAIKIEAYELDGQVVHLGDTVNLKSRKHSADLYKKAIAYEFNALTEEYISITFDDKPGVGGSGMSSGLSNAADAILGASATAQDVAIERALKNADAAFDAEFNKRSEAIKDDIEKIKAHAEAIKAAMTEQLNLKINQSKSEVTDRLQKEFDQKLSSASTDLAAVRANLTQAQSRLSGDISQIQSDIAAIRGKQSQSDSELAKQAQSINQAKSELAGVKTNLTQAQSQLNSNISQIRSDVGSIRTKQGQHETEIAKQVSALNATKTELAGVKSAQATFEQSTTRRLSELANVADGKASKSEVKQTADELASRIASVSVGGTNLYALSKNAEIVKNGHVADFKMDILSGEISFKATGLDPYVGEAMTHPRTVSVRNGVRIPVISGRSIYVTISNPVFAKNYISYFDERGSTVKHYRHYGTNSFVISPKELAGVSFVTLRFGCGGSSFEIGDVLKTKIKVEYGTIPTDWSPAPEDVETQISAVESTFRQKADSLEAGVNRLTEGLKTKADSSALTVLSDGIKQSVKSLETDTQNKLNQKLSTAEFEVRASGIRQEIVNATKDKADKTLVTAEAGKLREELASLRVGGVNLLKRTKAFDRVNGRSQLLSETYNNCVVRYFKNADANSAYQDIVEYSNALYPELGGTYTLSFWAKGTGEMTTFFYGRRGYLSVLSGTTSQGLVSKAGDGYCRFALSADWQRYYVVYKLADAPIDATSIYKHVLFRHNSRSTTDEIWLAGVKLERGNLATDYSENSEDVDGLITEAKASFERTAQGLRVDLAAVQAYVNADGTRAEAQRTYSREETARQLTAERKLIEAGYVAKAQHTEDVRSISRRFEELAVGGNNLLAYSNFNKNGYYQNGLKRDNNYVYSNLIEIKSTDYILQIWELEPKEKRLWAGLQLFDEQRNPISNGYSTFWFNGYLKKDLKPPQNARYLAISFENLILDKDKAKFKLEIGTIPTDWSPAPEDTTSYADTKLAEFKQGIDGQLASVQSALNTANGSLTSFNTWKQSAQETLNKVGRVETGLNEAKTSLAEFKQTAQGLRTDLTAVQAYVNTDGSRAEALRSYSREETARQLTAERKAIEASYVAKAQHVEDVRGLTRRFEELKTSSETKLAEYRQSVEGQFATMSSQIGESLKKTDISITPGQIVLGTGKVVNGQTLASLFVQNPESMQAITKLMRITGDLIVDGSITGRDLAAGAITTPHLAAGAVTAEVLGANAVTADKVKADDALLEKLSAGEALLRKLMAKDAFVNTLQSIDFTANQIRGGVLGSIDGTLNFDLNKNTLIMGSNTAAIKRVLPGHPTQFMRYETERKGNVDYTRTIIGSNRNGSEKFDSVTFAGLVVENSNKAGIEDSLRLYGDNTYFRHAQGDVGWNINAVTQRMTPATWNKESSFWARSFVAPKHRNPNGRDWVKLEESVAALWRLWEHAAGNQVTMTGAMRDKVRELFQNYGYNYGIS